MTIAGGHSIDAPEPIYGLAVLGLVAPGDVKRNDTARAGDVLVLGKGLGIGILSAALKRGELGAAGYAELLATATRLNTVGIDLAGLVGVHAMTDVTGFGLLGHLLEMCRGAGLAATVDAARLPILPAARVLAERGVTTGAAGRNWASYGHEVRLPEALPAWRKAILCDPQTSGGLLVACAPAAAERVLRLFHDQGYADAQAIGAMATGEPGVTVR